ncbi:MAG: hypothetical protein IKT00_00435 [Prevotella sp.]|nr:hypothetical protein [Prevotella sp.]
MKSIFFVFLIVLLPSSAMGQEDNLYRLVEFYKNADKECYTKQIQQSMNQLKLWYEDSICTWIKDDLLSFHIKTALSPLFKGNYKDSLSYPILKNENKVLIMTVYVDWEKYCEQNFLIDLADCMQIDSTRTFMIACVDDNMHIKGFTDLLEKGLYIETDKTITRQPLWVDLDLIRSEHGRNAFIKAYTQHPELKRADAIMCVVNDNYFTIVPSGFLFVLDGKVMRFDFSGELVEYNSFIRDRRFIWEYNHTKEQMQEIKNIYLQQMNYNSYLDFKKEDFLLPETEMKKNGRYGRTPSEKIRMCR